MLPNCIKLCCAFMLTACLCAAQQNTRQQALTKQMTKLDQIIATSTGTMESFDQLIDEAKKGLALTTPEEHRYRFQFYQSAGTGYYYKRDFKAAAKHLENAYTEAQKAKFIEAGTKSLGNLISIYHYMDMQLKADSAARLLKHIVETVDTLKNKGDIYYNLGLYNQQQKSFYGIALEYFLKSTGLHKSIVDTTNIAKLKINYAVKLAQVAETYLQLNQPEKALQYLEYLKPYLSLSKIIDISAYGKFVRSYILLKDKNSALKYYNLLHQTAVDMPGKWSELVSSNLEMARLALYDKDYVLTKKYIDKADAQAKIDNKEVLTSSVNQTYGDYYKAIHNYKQALYYYKIAENQFANNKLQYVELLRSLADLEILTGSTSAASGAFNKYVDASDSLTQQKTASSIAEMEAVYQNNEKNKQLAIQETELLFAQKQKIWLIGGILLFGIIAVLLLVIYYNQRKTSDILDEKNKTLSLLNNALETANQTKAKLFSIISHDLRSPINQVYQFLKLQQLSPNRLDESQKELLSNKIQTATGSLLETMEDLLVWSKSQMSQFATTKETVYPALLTDGVIQLLQLNIAEKNIVCKNDFAKEWHIETDPYFLQTIIRNLVQNAIKASPENETIVVGGEQSHHKIMLTITNKGGAFTQQQYEQILANTNTKASLSGFGLKLIGELINKLQFTILFENPDAETTHAKLVMS